MKKRLISLSIIAITISSIVLSCKKKEKEPEPDETNKVFVEVEGKEWVFTRASASKNLDTSFSIHAEFNQDSKGVEPYERVSLKFTYDSKIEDTFLLNVKYHFSNSYKNGLYIDEDYTPSSGKHYYSDVCNSPEGRIIVTEHDSINKTLSGTFEGVGCELQNSAEKRTVSKGRFVKVKYF